MMIPVVGIAVVLIVCALVLFFSEIKGKVQKDEASPKLEGMQALSTSEKADADRPLIPVPGVNKRVCGYLVDFLPVTVIQALTFFVGGVNLHWIYFLPYWLLRDSFKGRSLGKRFVGLRVIKDDGSAATSVQSMIRNIPLVIPFLSPIEYFILRKQSEGKRIGDIMAQTRVEDLRPEALDKKFFLKSALLGLATLTLFTMPILVDTIARVKGYVEPATDFINYHERAKEAFPKNPELASTLALKAEILGTYDLMRTFDTNSDKAWRMAQEDMRPIHQWAAYHPKKYRRNMRDVIRWANKQDIPQYPPYWVARFGLESVGVDTDWVEIKVGKNSKHQPARDWKNAIESLGQFAEDEVSWRDMNEAIKIENIKKTLAETREDVVKAYSRVLEEETLVEVSGHLQQMIDGFDDKSGTVGEKMLAVMADIQSYLDEFDDQLNPPNPDIAKAVLRAVSTAMEAYAKANGGKYPLTMDTLVNADPPYLNANLCGMADAGYRFMCGMSEKDYLITAKPLKEESDLTEITIKKGGVLSDK